jgi:hypothetical protein
MAKYWEKLKKVKITKTRVEVAIIAGMILIAVITAPPGGILALVICALLLVFLHLAYVQVMPSEYPLPDKYVKDEEGFYVLKKDATLKTRNKDG